MARGNLQFQRQPGSPFGKNDVSRTLYKTKDKDNYFRGVLSDQVLKSRPTWDV